MSGAGDKLVDRIAGPRSERRYSGLILTACMQSGIAILTRNVIIRIPAAGLGRNPLKEDLNLNPLVSVLLLFASVSDCSQNQITVSDTLRLLSDF